MKTNNQISKKFLRQVQLKTLSEISDYLSETYGPFGSNTKIIKGNDPNSITVEYSKDGDKVLSNIIYQYPIESSIQQELKEITRYVEDTVGDGTTTAILLSNIIFDLLVRIERSDVPAHLVISTFKKVIDDIQCNILNNGKEVTIEDLYSICMTSTNSNEYMAKAIIDLYKEYGFETYIDVNTSNTIDTIIKSYDGVTLDSGYVDPAFINDPQKHTCGIYRPRIYFFAHPVDTVDMIQLYHKVLYTNIIEKIQKKEPVIPTVLIAPRLSQDIMEINNTLLTVLYQFDKSNMYSAKPPVLVITDLSMTEEEVIMDLAKLCGTKPIKKYINRDIQLEEQKEGSAPTVDTIVDNFYGTCDYVEADATKTKFINPLYMYERDENGEVLPEMKTTPIFDGIINYLEQEIASRKQNISDAASIGRLIRRKEALNTNLVELFVGGISIADRNSTKDLVLDAVKNCRDAIKHGVGHGASFEGLDASLEMIREIYYKEFPMKMDNNLYNSLLVILYKAYRTVVEKLYTTYYGSKANDKLEELYMKYNDKENPIIHYDIPIDEFNSERIEVDVRYDYKRGPVNFNTGNVDGTVRTSINTDIVILEAVSKIISLMYSANQSLVQAPSYANIYGTPAELAEM